MTEYATRHSHATPGKQTAVEVTPQAAVAPGKRTLVEQLPQSSDELIGFVTARAGELVDDGYGFRFLVLPAGSFEIVEAPPANKKSVHQVIAVNGAYPEAWKAIARKLLAKAPPPRAPAATAPQPAAPVAEPPPALAPEEGSVIGDLLDRAEEQVDAVAQGARDLWHRVMTAMASSQAPSAGKVPAPAPAVPATAPVGPAPAAAPAASAPAAKPKATKTKRKQLAGSNEGFSDGDKQYRTLEPTMPGGTLDAASTRAELGNDETTYTFGVGNSLVDGDPAASKFYCSGLSIWTLSAVGYDVNQPIRGADGEPYFFTLVSPNPDAKTKEKEPEVEAQQFVTLKRILDGEPPAVEAMILVEQNQMTNGGWIGRVRSEALGGAGHSLGYAGAEPAQAVRGAAAAFAYAGIGSEVEELQQKPGDFAQTRHKESHYEKRDVEKPGKDGKPRTVKENVKVVAAEQRGFGHAWQVWKVTALGGAVFGKPGSPVAADGEPLDGWHDNVVFVIDKDTEPSLVGAHTVRSAIRLEANTKDARDADGNKMGGDGGVQLTAFRNVPDTEAGTDHHVFVGRLGTSKWASWEKATQETAAGVAEPALSPPPLISAEPVTDGAPGPDGSGG